MFLSSDTITHCFRYFPLFFSIKLVLMQSNRLPFLHLP
ncbi:CRISPR-associated DxTHG motif protein [Paenibacillus chitinolyticus]